MNAIVAHVTAMEVPTGLLLFLAGMMLGTLASIAWLQLRAR